MSRWFRAKRLDLALVIPVRDDPAGLARLLDQARRMAVFSQIVVVDDGSCPPVAAARDLTLLRQESPRGAGPARNRGLAAVRTKHLLFFDADDLLTAELPLLLADLAEAGPFDLCLFKHADSRLRAEGRWGQPGWDDRFWQAAGHGMGALRPAKPGALPLLAQTANYPWNKIQRTDFLRRHGLGCAATEVHQDIPLHWLGLLAAERVLVSERICAWHAVDPAGDRLTNRRGAERLQVFAALDPVAEAVAGRGPEWQAALAAFALGLADWGWTVLDPGLRPGFRAAETDWLRRRMAGWLPALAARDPALAERLRRRILPETAG